MKLLIYLPLILLISLIPLFIYQKVFPILSFLIDHNIWIGIIFIFLIVIILFGFYLLIKNKKRMVTSIFTSINVFILILAFQADQFIRENGYNIALEREFSEVKTPQIDFRNDKANGVIRFIALPVFITGEYIPLSVDDSNDFKKYSKNIGLRYLMEEGIYGCVVDTESNPFIKMREYAIEYNHLVIQHLKQRK